jgi:Zn-dependent protease
MRLLDTSWPLFRAFGVDVRVSWTLLLWPLVFTIMLSRAGWTLGESIAIGTAITIVNFACVYTHEMGHIAAGWRYGITSRRITLRGLGGLAHMDSGAPNPRAEMVISLAGPATHVPWGAIFYGAHLVTRGMDIDPIWSNWLQWFAVWQLTMIVFNLLPFYPFDGGRTLRALLATRMHSNKASLYTANVGYGGAVVLGLTGLTMWFGQVEWLGAGEWGFLMVWIGVENFLACRRLTMEARWGDGPYEPQEAWKGRGYQDPYGESLAEHERLMREAEKEDEQAADARRKERARREDLQRRVDQLLDRINEVGGLDNLSADERKELTEASELLRR